MISAHTVLAVDDEPANRRAVCRALSDDCRVLSAASGSEALALMDREPVALVIADQRMPGMSGAEFLAETVARHPAVIRIVLTGYTDVDSLLDAINRSQVYHFLGKPWLTNELRQVVRRGLERFAADLERQRLLEALRGACAQAQREAEQKTRLLTLAAHELGTPLHILLNVMGLLQEWQMPETSRQWLDVGERAVRWLARGVSQMQDAARIRGRQLRLHLQAVEIGAMAAAAADEIRAAAGDRRLEIAVDVAAHALTVRADPQWLRQAVSGLLSNAVRFTPDGGRVRISALRDGDRVVIAVADSGIGIAAAELDEVFEPFSAASGDPLLHGSGAFAFGARGLGLGLAMVRAITEAHGGTVDVESAPGAGSCFTLHLPAAPSDSDEPQRLATLVT